MSSSFIEMRRWFDIVQTNSNEELEKDIDCNVCVFKVPKSISSAKPEAYTPQLIGLGPNHHLQPQLMEMHGASQARRREEAPQGVPLLKIHRAHHQALQVGPLCLLVLPQVLAYPRRQNVVVDHDCRHPVLVRSSLPALHRQSDPQAVTLIIWVP